MEPSCHKGGAPNPKRTSDQARRESAERDRTRTTKAEVRTGPRGRNLTKRTATGRSRSRTSPRRARDENGYVPTEEDSSKMWAQARREDAMPARKIKEKLAPLRPLCSVERRELSKAKTQKIPCNLPLAKPGRGTKTNAGPPIFNPHAGSHRAKADAIRRKRSLWAGAKRSSTSRAKPSLR